MSTDYNLYNEITNNLSELFNNSESKQNVIISYPDEILSNRSRYVEWLIFLNKTLSFRTETLFRAITLFDTYMSKLKKINLIETKLTLIACLNIATKLEEVNVNFLNFFTERCLNEDNERHFNSTDLAKKEIEILKLLKFRTNFTNPYDFISTFHQLCMKIFNNDTNQLNYLINISEEILMNCLYDQNYIYLCPKQIALYAIKETLSYLSIYNNSFISNLIWTPLCSFDHNNQNNNSNQNKQAINTSSPMKIQAM